MPSIAYVNGKFSPIEDAVVSVEDRGFQLGDGIYEVLRTYRGRLHAVEEHMRRLFRSLDAIGLRHTFTAAGLEKIIVEAVQRAGFTDSLVYLQITRGATKRAKEFPKDTEPTLVITVRKLELPSAAMREQGVAIQTADDIRWQRCDIKTVCLLPNVLASPRRSGRPCPQEQRADTGAPYHPRRTPRRRRSLHDRHDRRGSPRRQGQQPPHRRRQTRPRHATAPRPLPRFGWLKSRTGILPVS
ncbi:MAG: aminotransferase class IV [Verrucomicrobia bacterium]|nr:aminotransferase class IV [Verrucomicrobiota bacterium]